MTEAAVFDERKAQEEFEAHVETGADLEKLDPICAALGDYLRENPPREGGRVLPNRIIALRCVNQLLAWEKSIWEHP